ncbi:uncharacterized protein EV420DRAFT_1764274 [Desarmillaria tabescens]|uniref:F-box domain-containing protein n=1 Tax=Armillaria tabescens TaxID=1929756 RepID=A0AA39KD70_ARMTA|nr:uncharacterized protein EV420DRAFT_1764274 [Desarmillaria tabescens]KAK0458648.1 hypothetical protein EV420DRAFT_1764274 [Desarmillaria tabescens]
MPVSHRQIAPDYFRLQRLSLDLILEIFAWCAPLDLVILRSVSRNIKTILDQHGNRCWTRARSNLLRLPTVPSSLNRKYSEISLINYFFYSGCNKCLSCGRSVDDAFPSLTYMIYLCIDAGCYSHFMSNRQGYLFSYNPQERSFHKYKPILQFLYYDPSTVKKLYLVRQAKRELAWYKQIRSWGDDLMLHPLDLMTERKRTHRILQQHANKMQKWAAEYGRELVVVNKKNRAFLKTVTQSKRLDYLTTLRTPAMRRTLEEFNRRLTCLTLTVWRDIMTQVVKEYHEFRASKLNKRTSPQAINETH